MSRMMPPVNRNRIVVPKSAVASLCMSVRLYITRLPLKRQSKLT